LKKFYENVVNDIKILGNLEKGNKDNEHDFVRSLLTKDEEVKEGINQDFLTIEQKLKLLQLKNNTIKRLAKSEKEENPFQIESSLAMTEDEMPKNINTIKEVFIKEESDVSMKDNSILFKEPLKKSIEEPKEENDWFLD